jgi:hypothetical protein
VLQLSLTLVAQHLLVPRAMLFNIPRLTQWETCYFVTIVTGHLF